MQLPCDIADTIDEGIDYKQLLTHGLSLNFPQRFPP